MADTAVGTAAGSGYAYNLEEAYVDDDGDDFEYAPVDVEDVDSDYGTREAGGRAGGRCWWWCVVASKLLHAAIDGLSVYCCKMCLEVASRLVPRMLLSRCSASSLQQGLV